MSRQRAETLGDLFGAERAARIRDQFREMPRLMPDALLAIGHLGGVLQSNFDPDPYVHAREAGKRDMALTILRLAGIDLTEALPKKEEA